MATGTGQEVGFKFKATDRTGNTFKGLQKNLKTTNREASTLSSRFRNMARATAAVEGPLGGTAGRLSVIATLLGNAHVGMVAFSAGITGITLVSGLAIKKWGEFEEQGLKVEQMLKTTAGASGLTKNEIVSMADEIGMATLQSRNGVLEASSVLMSFKSISGEAFKETMMVAADMSALVGTDLKSSVVQLGKALEDPTRGLSALARSGISFTQTQKDMIVAMSEAGQAAEAQAEILGILKGQLGGAGAAAGGGLSGALDLVSHGWDKLMVELADTGAGEAATNMLNDLGNTINNIANEMDEEYDIVGKSNALFIERLELMRRLKEEIAKGGVDWSAAGIARKNLREEIIEISFKLQKYDALIAKEEKAKESATEKSAAVKKGLKEEADAVLAKEAAEKLAKEAKNQRETDEKGAGSFGEQLAKEAQQAADAFLTKEQMEDAYLERKLEKIAFNNEQGFISDEEKYAQEQSAYAAHALKISKIDADTAKKREKNEQKLSKTLNSMRLQVANQAVNLFKMLAGDSKAAKIAGLALEKGIAIAQTVMTTETAAMQAYASQLIPGDVTSPERGAAAYGKVKALGSASVAIIAATGLAQAASISKGGAGGAAGGGGGGVVASTPALEPPALVQEALLPEENTQSSIRIVINNPELLSDESITNLVDQIKDQVDNRDVTLISSTSRNGRDLATS